MENKTLAGNESLTNTVVANNALGIWNVIDLNKTNMCLSPPVSVTLFVIFCVKARSYKLNISNQLKVILLIVRFKSGKDFFN